MPSTADTQVHGLNDDEISIIIFDKGKGKRKEHLLFFTVIGGLMFHTPSISLRSVSLNGRIALTSPARSVPGRPLLAVFNYLRRKYHPMKAKGLWSSEEDDELAAYVFSSRCSPEMTTAVLT
jgi:hypothetical protein